MTIQLTDGTIIEDVKLIKLMDNGTTSREREYVFQIGDKELNLFKSQFVVVGEVV